MQNRNEIATKKRARLKNPDLIWQDEINSKTSGETNLKSEDIFSDSKTHKKRKQTLLSPEKQIFHRDSDSTVDELREKTKFIAKLLYEVDSRNTDEEVEVSVTYALMKGEKVLIPKDSLLVGKIIPKISKKRVEFQFHEVVFPNGKRFKIKAYALDSKDYRRGIIGKYHSEKAFKHASRVGFAMASGMSEVMIEREALGNSISNSPRSTNRNALINGVKQVIDQESRELENDSQRTQDYIIVPAQKALIIKLENKFKENL